MTVIWRVIKMSNSADKFSFSPKKEAPKKLYIKLFGGFITNLPVYSLSHYCRFYSHKTNLGSILPVAFLCFICCLEVFISVTDEYHSVHAVYLFLIYEICLGSIDLFVWSFDGVQFCNRMWLHVAEYCHYLCLCFGGGVTVVVFFSVLHAHIA